MKRVLSVALCLAWFYSPAQYADDPATNMTIRVLLDKYMAGGIDSAERKQLTTLTYGIQNKGFFYGEPYRGEYDSSLIEIDRALLIWSTLRDTANIANLRKFRGFLLGKHQQFEAGKKEAREAIRLFNSIKNPSGVAVSQYDLSLVFIMASQPDSAIYFGRLAYNYFFGREVILRSFIYGNQLLQTLGAQARYKEALVIQKQLQAALSAYKKELTQFELKHIADFYSLSRDLYKKLGQNGESDEYRKKYENLVVILTDQGVRYANDHRGF